MEMSNIYGTIMISLSTISLVMPSDLGTGTGIGIAKKATRKSGTEVTHGTFFGENISRAIKTLKK